MAVGGDNSVVAKVVRSGRARSASPTMAVSINPFMYRPKKVSPIKKSFFMRSTYNPQKMHAAVTKIQAAWRGAYTRKIIEFITLHVYLNCN